MRLLVLLLLPLVSLAAAGGDAAAVSRPVAAVDAPREVHCGQTFRLTGQSGTDGATVQEWRWRQTAGPRLILPPEQASRRQVQLSSPEPGRFRFALRVTDGKHWSEAVQAEVTVEGPPTVPITRVRGGGRYGRGETVCLDASGSLAPPRRTLSFNWRQVAGDALPLGGASNAPRRIINDPPPGRYVWEVIAQTPDQSGQPVRVQVDVPALEDGVADTRPRARLAAPSRARPGTNILLDGRDSTDADGDVLSFHWRVLEGTDGAVFEDHGRTARLLPQRPGSYEVGLMTHDGQLASHMARVRIEVGDDGEDETASGAPRGLLQRRVNADLRGANLRRALRVLAEQTGVTLHAARSLTEAHPLEALPVHLNMRNLPAQVALDWIARQVECRYVLAGDRAVVMTRGYEKIGSEPLDVFASRADALCDTDGDGEDLLAVLRETIRPALWAHPETTLTVEPEQARVSAVVPFSAVPRLSRVLAELRAPVARPPIPLNAPDDASALLDRRVVMPTATLDAGASLDALAEAAGLSIGCCLPNLTPAHGPAPGPPLTWQGDERTVADALARVLAATKLTGYRVEGPDAIWLFAGTPPLPHAQDLWQAAEVSAFDLRPFLARGISTSLLRHVLRHRVAPGSWRDPSVCLQVHPHTQRLLVIHHPEVVRRVSAYLAQLLQSDGGDLWGVEAQR